MDDRGKKRQQEIKDQKLAAERGRAEEQHRETISVNQEIAKATKAAGLLAGKFAIIAAMLSAFLTGGLLYALEIMKEKREISRKQKQAMLLAMEDMEHSLRGLRVLAIPIFSAIAQKCDSEKTTPDIFNRIAIILPTMNNDVATQSIINNIGALPGSASIEVFQFYRRRSQLTAMCASIRNEYVHRSIPPGELISAKLGDLVLIAMSDGFRALSTLNDSTGSSEKGLKYLRYSERIKTVAAKKEINCEEYNEIISIDK
jgi:hypothetical protein